MSDLSVGQTRFGGQTFKDFFTGCRSLHHSGTLAATVTDSAFRFDDMRSSFPPLSASYPARTAPRNEMRTSGSNRTLGTSRITGSTSWGEPRASGKRRGSLPIDGSGPSTGHHQRQTLKLADITHFDLMRPSAFDKLSGLYRDRSALDGPSAHAMLGVGDKENEGSVKTKPKMKSGPSHHVHLPRISVDSSPPLVSFRHSRIKPSTLTEHETAVPGVAPRTTDRSLNATDGKFAVQTQPIRKNEPSTDRNRNTRSSAERRKQPKHINEILPSTHGSYTPQRTADAGGKENTTVVLNPVWQDIDNAMPKKKYKDIHSSNESEASRAALSTPAPAALEITSKQQPEHSRSLLVDTDCLNSSARRKEDKIDSQDLTLSEYTSIFINNNGFEGETLSVVKSDTFLGEKRSVRFSVSNEVIEYEPGSSLAYDNRSKLDMNRKLDIIGE